jgi:transcriptional regulator with XRE-family HTH domain
MFQKDVAEQIGVGVTTIFNWEANTSQPDYQYMPTVIEFLGYNPLPEGKTWSERLVRHRTALGLSQEEACRRIGVDQSTLSGWEQGEREPARAYAERAERFMAGEKASQPPAVARTA